MATPIPDSLERLSPSDLIGVVRDLIGEVGRLRAENEKLSDALTKLKAEHQAVKDELARLKKLPPRPPQKPSGMDKATDGGGDNKSRGGAGRLAPQGLRGHRGSGPEPEPAGDALSARALGNAGGRADHRRTRFRDCRGLWPQSASFRAGAAFLRTSHLRADRRSSQRHGRGDF